jgi:hypothetical protein
MRRFVVFGFLIFAFALSSVKADVLPPNGIRPGPPPPPPGPEKAVIRGVEVVRGYGYWQGRRWLSYIGECPSSVPACEGKDLRSCLITEFDGQPVTNGDIGYLQAKDKAAAGRPIKLTLRGCRIDEIELAP